jgi:hypothetical protein
MTTYLSESDFGNEEDFYLRLSKCSNTSHVQTNPINKN